jgi:hypothetical protein
MPFSGEIGVQEGILRTLPLFFRVDFFPEGSQNFGTELVIAAACLTPQFHFLASCIPDQIGHYNDSLDDSSS